ncbi:unnamed protein product [Brassica rapa]|uniref:Uncharacterized protein n=1 Tax=Brassica campestris TaxID=3711 RepID=A0A8D9G9C5_BRACM|nr:unnamed protein product [Brassica rapa]
MKRKYQPPLGADGHRFCSKPQSKQRIDHKKNKDVPLSTVFARLLHDVTNRKGATRFQTQVTVSNPTNKRVCFDKENNDNPKQTKKSRIHEAISSTIRGLCSSHVIFESQNTTKTNIQMTRTRETTIDSGISKNSEQENRGILFFNHRMNGNLLGSIDECDDLEVECSSQDSSDTEISDDEQSTVQEPEKVDQSGRVNLLAALFKKTFSEVKTKAKAVSSKEDG